MGGDSCAGIAESSVILRDTRKLALPWPPIKNTVGDSPRSRRSGREARHQEPASGLALELPGPVRRTQNEEGEPAQDKKRTKTLPLKGLWERRMGKMENETRL